ncbi:MAG TPA: hypothetical protein P5556_00385 [Candidatus Gastranaerophilales bacterium]|nr:hypothetical protein [Candidatus Gastranaerophilales bacterium]
MFKEQLKLNQPFVSGFLESALIPGKEKLANAYLLTGNNTIDMYFLALETARILNCSHKTENCACNNCQWIRQNRHPAVITISPIDYIHANKDGKPKTVITIDQARFLKKALSVSSQYHRVIVFTDAKEGKEYESKAEQLWGNYKDFIAPPVLENSNSERESWLPLPLSYKTFHSEPANALLKIIEEPPPRVTFFFFTKDKEDMISTIVSRSQAISLKYNPENYIEDQVFENFFGNFPPNSAAEGILYSEKLIELAKENSLTLEEAINRLERYLILQIRQASGNKEYCLRLINQVKSIQKALIELKSYVNPQAVADSLAISLASRR